MGHTSTADKMHQKKLTETLSLLLLWVESGILYKINRRLLIRADLFLRANCRFTLKGREEERNLPFELWY